MSRPNKLLSVGGKLSAFTAIFLLIVFACFSGCNYSESRAKRLHKNTFKIQASEKINGVNFVAPPRAVDSQWTAELKRVNSSWVALVPYAFTKKDSANVRYGYANQHWGESAAGIIENARQAHQAGLKVMLKPHVWMQGGWIGDFNLKNENDWLTWEKDYRAYLMQLTEIATDENIEMICIGTEYRNAVKKRPDFWKGLIKDIRKIYNGKLTYCANWDDYQDVLFWEDLDYIGISAYFPLSDTKTPTTDELSKAWKPVKKDLKAFSDEQRKPILFTEYGYRSMDSPAWRSWEKEYQEMPINNKAQANAYEALFLTFWNEPWFAGGFSWKWYSAFRRMDPKSNHDWTPQNKQAETVMQKYYSVK